MSMWETAYKSNAYPPSNLEQKLYRERAWSGEAVAWVAHEERLSGQVVLGVLTAGAAAQQVGVAQHCRARICYPVARFFTQHGERPDLATSSLHLSH